MTSFLHVFLSSCPCFYLCQHKTFISLTKNNKCKLLAQHEMFSSPPRKSTALSVFSHKMNPLLGLHSGQWCVDLQCILYEAIISTVFGRKEVIFGRKKLSPACVPVMLGEAGSWQLSFFWEGLCLWCRLQTPRTSCPTPGRRQMSPYSSPSFPGDCTYSGTKVWKRDGQQKVCKARLTENLHVMKCGRLKD